MNAEAMYTLIIATFDKVQVDLTLHSLIAIFIIGLSH